MDIQSFLLGIVAGVVGMLVLFWRLAVLSRSRRHRALREMAKEGFTAEEWAAAKVLNMATDPEYAAMMRDQEARERGEGGRGDR